MVTDIIKSVRLIDGVYCEVEREVSSFSAESLVEKKKMMHKLSLTSVTFGPLEISWDGTHITYMHSEGVKHIVDGGRNTFIRLLNEANELPLSKRARTKYFLRMLKFTKKKTEIENTSRLGSINHSHLDEYVDLCVKIDEIEMYLS